MTIQIMNVLFDYSSRGAEIIVKRYRNKKREKQERLGKGKKRQKINGKERKRKKYTNLSEQAKENEGERWNKD